MNGDVLFHMINGSPTRTLGYEIDLHGDALPCEVWLGCPSFNELSRTTPGDSLKLTERAYE